MEPAPTQEMEIENGTTTTRLIHWCGPAITPVIAITASNEGHRSNPKAHREGIMNESSMVPLPDWIVLKWNFKAKPGSVPQ